MVIPAHYSSYSVELPADASSSKARTVRLILIEYIPGSSMRELRPQDFSQLERKQIIKTFYRCRVRLGDQHRRNAIVNWTPAPNLKAEFIRVFLLNIGMNEYSLGNGWGVSERAETTQYYLGPITYIFPLLRWHEYGVW